MRSAPSLLIGRAVAIAWLICLAVPSLSATSAAATAKKNAAHHVSQPNGQSPRVKTADGPEKNAVGSKTGAPAGGEGEKREHRTRECTRKINRPYTTEHEKKDPLSVGAPPITLDLHQTEPVINFGPRRERTPDYVVLKASRPIPPQVKSTMFEIDGLEPMKRVGEGGLESARLKAPTYSPPRLFNHRREISFNLCVNGEEGDPGVYTGQFLFSGPEMMASVTIPQTAQLKLSHFKFFKYLLIALFLTALFLVIRVASEFERDETTKEKWLRGLAMLLPVLAAGGAMYLVYDNTPTWGTDLPISVAALIGTAFTAAGLGSSFSNATERLGETWKNNRHADDEPKPPDTAGGSTAADTPDRADA